MSVVGRGAWGKKTKPGYSEGRRPRIIGLQEGHQQALHRVAGGERANLRKTVMIWQESTWGHGSIFGRTTEVRYLLRVRSNSMGRLGMMDPNLRRLAHLQASRELESSLTVSVLLNYRNETVTVILRTSSIVS